MRCPGESKRLDKGASYISLSESLLAFANSDMPMNISHSLTSDANLLETLMINNVNFHKTCLNKLTRLMMHDVLHNVSSTGIDLKLKTWPLIWTILKCLESLQMVICFHMTQFIIKNVCLDIIIGISLVFVKHILITL